MSLDRWLAVIGIALAVLGIPISVLVSRYYYRRSDRKRVPTFVIQNRTALSDPKLTKCAENLKLSCDGKAVGKEGITEAKVYFWNSGTMPIRAEDVLRPYTISLAVPILSYSINKSSREVTGLTVERLTDGEIELAFSVLEGGDGCTLKIVFDGPVDAGIEFDGAVLDSPKPLILPPHEFYSLSRSRRLFEAYGPLFLIPASLITAAIGGIIVLGSGAGLQWLLKKGLGQTTGEDAFKVLCGVVLSFLLIFAVGSNAWPGIRRVNDPYLPPDIRG